MPPNNASDRSTANGISNPGLSLSVAAKRSVFDYLLPVQDGASIMSALRLAGLPLSCTTPDPEHEDGIDENDASKIVCIAEIGEHISTGVVLTEYTGILIVLNEATAR